MCLFLVYVIEDLSEIPMSVLHTSGDLKMRVP